MKAKSKKKAKASAESGRGSNQKVVLLAVSGQSTAIITETVWKLANPGEGKKKVVPDDVVVITTTRGLADINRDLKNLDYNILDTGPKDGIIGLDFAVQELRKKDLIDDHEARTWMRGEPKKASL